jgi:glycogen(starch) synthase
MIQRVLMSTDAVGGVWTYCLDLTKGLGRRGVEVHLAVMGPAPSPDQRREAQLIPNLTLHEASYKLEWMEDPWDDLDKAGEWLLALEDELCPDLVHLNGFVHGDWPFCSPKILVGHSCVLSWWRAVHGEDAPVSWARYEQAVRNGLHSADLVVAPTACMLWQIQKLYGPLARAKVIHNGRSGRFAPREKKPEVFAAGRMWDKAKNLECLREAAPEIQWKVLFAGGRESDAGQNFESLGRITPDEICERMGTASIFAHPAKYEPFGLAPLEAALSGCALVLGDIPSLREVWGDAAIYVDPGSPRDLAEACNSLASTPSLLAERSLAALRRSRNYSVRRMADEYLASYRECLGLRDREVAVA